MKRFFLGLAGFALLSGSPVMAQDLAIQPKGEVVPVNHFEFRGGSCPTGGATCVPECYTKVTPKTVFCSGSEPFCLCYNRSCRLFCRDCESGHCEDAHTRRFLTMKVVKCEEQAVKCVPAPGCCTTGGRIHGHASATPSIIPATQGVVTFSEAAPSVGQKMPSAAR